MPTHTVCLLEILNTFLLATASQQEGRVRLQFGLFLLQQIDLYDFMLSSVYFFYLYASFGQSNAIRNHKEAKMCTVKVLNIRTP